MLMKIELLLKPMFHMLSEFEHVLVKNDYISNLHTYILVNTVMQMNSLNIIFLCKQNNSNCCYITPSPRICGNFIVYDIMSHLVGY